MKVILLRDVAKIGRRYQVVEVPDGFALNKLIPRKDAEPATPVNIKRVENMRLKDKTSKEVIVKEIKKIAGELKSTPLEVLVQANQQGHLFQSIHADDIVNSAAKVNLVLPKEYIHLMNPIKSIGQHEIQLKNHGEVASIQINVVAK